MKYSVGIQLGNGQDISVAVLVKIENDKLTIVAQIRLEEKIKEDIVKYIRVYNRNNGRILKAELNKQICKVLGWDLNANVTIETPYGEVK